MSNLDLPFVHPGRIRFDPARPGMKSGTEWWAVVELDGELDAYYRWHLRKNWWLVDRGGMRRPAYSPAWNAHVSLIRGERPGAWLGWSEEFSRQIWDTYKSIYNGMKIDVEYSGHIRQTGDTTPRPDHFWFIPARVRIGHDLRYRLGLPIKDRATNAMYTNHITISRTVAA